MKDFSKIGFKHVTSTPHHHQGNGKAEAAVTIVKWVQIKDHSQEELEQQFLVPIRDKE